MRTARASGLDLGGDFVQVPQHGPGVAMGQNPSGSDAALGTDGAEDVGRLGPLIARRDGAGSSSRPAPCDRVLLADAGFVLPPDFYGRAKFQPVLDVRHSGGKVVLKAVTASGF